MSSPSTSADVYHIIADLQVTDPAGGDSEAIVEDKASGRHFRLGAIEARVLRCLIARGTLQMNSHEIQACVRESQADERTVRTFISWLIRQGLLKNKTATACAPRHGSFQLLQAIGWFYYFRLPLGSPDRLLNRLSILKWFFVLPVSLCWCSAAVVAILCQYDTVLRLLGFVRDLLVPANCLSFLIVWLVLKVAHELAHALTCAAYGCSVKQAGLAFILFAPVAYVDVTSMSKLPSRWQRMHIALAGVMAELGIAAIALSVWSNSHSPLVHTVAAQAFSLASFSTLVWNLNPLNRSDGYIALLELTGREHLHSLGSRYVRYCVDRYLLGLSNGILGAESGLPVWIKLFGIAAHGWRMVAMGGLLIAASELLGGFGKMIALLGLAVFFVWPVLIKVQSLAKLWYARKLYVGRLAIRLGLWSGLIAALLVTLPASLSRTLPGVVEYDPPLSVKSPNDGTIVNVHVENGQVVSQGQLLFTLRSDELELEHSRLQSLLLQAEQRLKSARWVLDTATLAQATSDVTCLTEQLADTRQRLDACQIRAATAGTVVARRVSELTGAVVKQGQELVMLGTESSKRLKVSLGEWERGRMDDQSSVHVFVRGENAYRSQLEWSDARLTTEVPDDSMRADAGGSLPLKANPDGTVNLLEQRANAYARLDPALSLHVRVGQRVDVLLDCERQSLARLLSRSLAQFFEAMLGA